MKFLKFVALLRGINVGGNKKVPMPVLKQMMEDLGFKNVKTHLNSGNIIFNAASHSNEEELEDFLENELLKSFGFQIPVIVRTDLEIRNIINSKIFNIPNPEKKFQFYITFIKSNTTADPKQLGIYLDGAFRLLQVEQKHIYSVLDITAKRSTDAMGILEKFFGKEITTRNYSSLCKMEKWL